MVALLMVPLMPVIVAAVLVSQPLGDLKRDFKEISRRVKGKRKCNVEDLRVFHSGYSQRVRATTLL